MPTPGYSFLEDSDLHQRRNEFCTLTSLSARNKELLDMLLQLVYVCGQAKAITTLRKDFAQYE
jgi:hypothetical protein